MIEKIFEKHLNIMEMFYDVSFVGDSSVDRIVSLHEMCLKNPVVYSKVREYAVFVHKNIRMDDGWYDYTNELSNLVGDSLFAYLMYGMGISNNLTSSTPKRHHWLAVSYLRCFQDKTSILRSKRVRAVVNSVVFQPYGVINAPVMDREFCHPFDEISGAYYDQSVESIFSAMESMYPNCLENSDSNQGQFEHLRSIVSSIVFFIAQSVRNPHPQNGFSDGSLREILQSMIKNGNSIVNGELFANFGTVQNDEVLFFSPYIPNRVFVQGDQKLMYIPMSHTQSLVISNHPVSKDEACDFTRRSRQTMIEHSRKRNLVLFGVNSHEL